MKHLAASVFVVISLLFIATAPPTAAKDGAQVIASCVSQASIELGTGDISAMLDDTDRDLVNSAMLERYPVLQRDGFMPSHILLWQKSGGELLYVALLANPQRPSEMCFTATFSATRFDFTQSLQRKYFVPGLKQA